MVGAYNKEKRNKTSKAVVEWKLERLGYPEEELGRHDRGRS